MKRELSVTKLRSKMFTEKLYLVTNFELFSNSSPIGIFVSAHISLTLNEIHFEIIYALIARAERELILNLVP